jgi:hypothetical protein
LPAVASKQADRNVINAKNIIFIGLNMALFSVCLLTFG